ncbi:MAG: DNRLRE domain-containing protein [Candidatus Velthaea sp.]
MRSWFLPATPPPVIVATASPAPVPLRQSKTLVIASPGLKVSSLNAARVGTLQIKVMVPTNVRNASGGTDCGAHLGLIGALLCPDMIKSGDLLLVWDWKNDTGLPPIDGYRVYRVDGGRRQLASSTNNAQQTLADLAQPAGGYKGACYAVTAVAATRESDLSPPYCAGGSSAATTVRLTAVHANSGFQFGRQGSGLGFIAPDGQVVGFRYQAARHFFGDEATNLVQRAAFAFDVTPFVKHRLVSAKLRLTIAWSQGQGNNHSCATAVGTGTEFWWQNNGSGLIPGSFGYDVVPTDTGPEITADVTRIVAPWLIGEPNYGFVLKNDDEDTNAFRNMQCQTAYTNPILELTSY